MSQSEQQLQNLWKLREYISETISHWTPYKNDISVTVSKVPAFLHDIDAIVGEHYPDFEIVWFGHIGDGNLHMNVLRPQGWAVEDFRRACDGLSPEVFRLVAEYHGSLSAEHGVGLLKRDYLHMMLSAEELTLMRTIKRGFDPDGILNPGKLLASST